MQNFKLQGVLFTTMKPNARSMFKDHGKMVSNLNHGAFGKSLLTGLETNQRMKGNCECRAFKFNYP